MADKTLFEIIDRHDYFGFLDYLDHSEADLNAPNENGQTPMDYAKDKRSYLIYKLLSLCEAKHSKDSSILDSDKKLSEYTEADRNEFMFYTFAAYSEHRHIITINEIQSMDLGNFDDYGHILTEIRDSIANIKRFDILHFAAMFNDVLTLHFLLDHNDNADQMDFDGKTPLDYAQENGSKLAEKVIRSYNGQTSEELYKEMQRDMEEDL